MSPPLQPHAQAGPAGGPQAESRADPVWVTPTAAMPAGPGGVRMTMVSSQDLMQGQNAVAIAHNGAVYRLQATRQGKLILTK